MGYPRTLDEYNAAELLAELERRTRLINQDQCDYCGQKKGTYPVCRFPKRHGGVEIESVDDGEPEPEDAVAHIAPLDAGVVLDAALEACHEVDRQDELARAGKFGGTHILPGGPDDARLRVLVEEIGEVAEELNEIDFEASDRGRVRDELVQTAAVAIAWIAAIDEGRP